MKVTDGWLFECVMHASLALRYASATDVRAGPGGPYKAGAYPGCSLGGLEAVERPLFLFLSAPRAPKGKSSRSDTRGLRPPEDRF